MFEEGAWHYYVSQTSFDKKVYTSVLATKKWKIEGFDIIFPKGYHPFFVQNSST